MLNTSEMLRAAADAIDKYGPVNVVGVWMEKRVLRIHVLDLPGAVGYTCREFTHDSNQHIWQPADGVQFYCLRPKPVPVAETFDNFTWEKAEATP